IARDRHREAVERGQVALREESAAEALRDLARLQQGRHEAISSKRWQAATWAEPLTGRVSGTRRAQTSRACGQRGWNRQPGGGSSSPGGSPGIARGMRRSRIEGSEEISARVYGWVGARKISRTVPISATRPAYMTASRSTSWAC